MNRGHYLLFIITLLFHLSLANLYYEGLYRLPAVCFLLMNYIVMVLLRDWLIGFNLFFIDKSIEKSIKNPPRLLMFGVQSFGKDPYRKHEIDLRRKVNFKNGLIKYLGFSVWTWFCLLFVVPKLGFDISFGLILSMVAAWFLLSVYQMSHFILVIGVSFLITLIAFLKGGGQSSWLFPPYLVALYTNISLYRSLTSHSLKFETESFSWAAVSSHVSRSINFVAIFAVMTFFMFHFLLQFQGKVQPKIDDWAEDVKEDVAKFASKKVEEYVAKQNEKRRTASEGELAGRQTSRNGKSKKEGKPGDENEDLQKIEKQLGKLLERERGLKLEKLAKKIEEEKELFKKLDREFRKNQSEFKDVERRQTMQRVSRAQSELKKMMKAPVQPEEMTKLKDLLAAKNIDLSTDQIKDLIGKQLGDGNVEMSPLEGAYEEPSASGSGISSKPDEPANPSIGKFENDFSNKDEKGETDSSSTGVAEGDGHDKPQSIIGNRETGGFEVARATLGSTRGQKNAIVRTAKPGLKAEIDEKEDREKALFKKKRLRDIQFQIEKVLSHILGLIKILFLFSLLYTAYRFYQYLKPRKVSEDIKVMVGLSDEKKSLVKRKWSVLRQNHLPPDQEVLNTYRFFLETMALAEFPKDEWIPATEYRSKIEEEFIGMDSAVAPITEYFCQSYYGKNTLTEADLANLRKARDHFFQRMVS